MNTAAAEKKNYAFIEGKESSVCAPGTDWNSFKKAIKEIESLSKEEEKALFEDVEKGKTAAALLSGKTSANETATRALEEEALASGDRQAMLKELKERGERAKKRIEYACLRLVAFRAEAMARLAGGRARIMEEADLFQEGYLCLQDAVNGFDRRRGNRFEAYADTAISRTMQRALNEKCGCMHVPAWRQNKLIEAKETREQLEKELNRTPARKEVAERMGISLERLLEIEQADFKAESFEGMLEAGKENELYDYMSGKAAASPEAELMDEEMKRAVEDLLLSQGLKSERIQALEMSCGFDCDPYSNAEIGRWYGKSREWARKLCDKALK